MDLIAFHDEPIDFERSFQRKLRDFRFEELIHRHDVRFVRFVSKDH